MYLILLNSCDIYKVKTNCFNAGNYSSMDMRRKVINQMDSVNKLNEFRCDDYKRVISTECVNDSFFKVKVLSRCNTFEYYYFDKEFQLIMFVKSLPNIY